MPVLNKAKQVVAVEPEVTVLPRQEHGDRVCVDDLELSDDQSIAYSKILFWARSGRPLFYLGGYAGTGKTSIAARLCSDISSVAFCAYTGKAASVLRSKLWGTGSLADVSTIHSLIYMPDNDSPGKSNVVGRWRGAASVNTLAASTGGKEKQWKLRKELGISPQVIVVDEASMVTSEILRDLLSFEIPVLLLGDPMQLPPVGGGEINLERVPESAMLERIHRQAEGSDILRFATQVRSGVPYYDIPVGGDVSKVSAKQLPFALRDAYEEYGTEDVGVLCYRNDSRIALNDMGQSAHRAVLGSRVPRDREFFSGMPVMNLFNYSTSILNGMRGFIRKAEVDRWWLSGEFVFRDEGVVVAGDAFGPQFDSTTVFDSLDACTRFFEKADPNVRLHPDTWAVDLGLLMDFAYAMTTHKSQGSQFRKVFLKVERPYGIDDLSFQRWLYTSVTRASESLTIVVG